MSTVLNRLTLHREHLNTASTSTNMAANKFYAIIAGVGAGTGIVLGDRQLLNMLILGQVVHSH